ncbi:MAG: hypothetical protein V3T05_10570 [Myxococcota bacterium]
MFGKERRNERVDIAVDVLVEVKDGEPKQYRTEDVSDTGLRMDISGVVSLAELTGGYRDVGLAILIGVFRTRETIEVDELDVLRDET